MFISLNFITGTFISPLEHSSTDRSNFRLILPQMEDPRWQMKKEKKVGNDTKSTFCSAYIVNMSFYLRKLLAVHQCFVMYTLLVKQ